VEVISIDRHRVPASLRDGTDGWKRIAVEDRKANIPDLACFRIDFPRWLRTLSRHDRSVISALAAGENPSSIADRFGISRGGCLSCGDGMRTSGGIFRVKLWRKLSDQGLTLASGAIAATDTRKEMRGGIREEIRPLFSYHVINYRGAEPKKRQSTGQRRTLCR
jgi:hypothetical protein